MTPPFRPSPSAAGSAPRGCGGDRCASPRDAWPLHHVRHDGVFCRLCSSCVLLYHPAAFCSACLLILPSAVAPAQDPHHDRVLAPPGPTASCSTCGLFAAHLSCIPGPAASFVCPPCAAAAESRPFTFAPSGGRRTIDERAARVLFVAARLAHESVLRAAAAAREAAERSVREAAAGRKRSREMLDAVFRAMEAEARDGKKPAAAHQPKKKTPKSSEANRDRDKMLKFNAMQQPTVAFAAAAAAAAASSMPSPREDKKPAKEAQGSADRAAKDDRKAALFGTLQA